MTETVKDRTLFHVTVAKPYKQPLAMDQTFQAGEKDNPYFGFYEGAREYPVNHNGGVMNIKAVAWLRQVRDGLINTTPDILARIGTEVAMHYVMLCRELIMEEIRREEFSGEPPSRQRCIYACDTIDEARYWHQRLHGEGTICQLQCSGTIHRADARLLLSDSEPLSVTRERARAYWRGEQTDTPEMETLFAGKATVIAIGL